MIEGVTVEVDTEAVVVRARMGLVTLSSAVIGGGFAAAGAIVNCHVPKGFRCEDSERVLDDFTRRRAIAPPWVGLLTAAWTEKAELVYDSVDSLSVLAVATIGLSNTASAGRSSAAAWAPSTINTILVVDADPEPAALVNLVITATEAKSLALAEAGVRTPDGRVASGTSTDAVVVAATGRGRSCRFGGPVSELGAIAGRAVRSALDAGIRRWLDESA
ncbi:MAG: adenosylcobinamide amidohydrolase [Candidatus Rokuibacteriota bacterium]